MLVNDASQVFTVRIFLVLYHNEWMLLVQFILQDNEISLLIYFSLFVQTQAADTGFATCF